ncbi:hypothetical protein ABZW18_15735 [Streptomyces sp. NPDC004647]|uniref:hypothetical protein n=1 Tax=Streptomyces sp. NPDC004647 TaxID=3154671 RepID=UPI00339E38F5
MSTATVSLLAGMALGFAGYFGGFGAFLVVAGLGALGLFIGSVLQGDLVVADFVHRREEARPSRSEFGGPRGQARRPRGDFGPTRDRVR